MDSDHVPMLWCKVIMPTKSVGAQTTTSVGAQTTTSLGAQTTISESESLSGAIDQDRYDGTKEPAFGSLTGAGPSGGAQGPFAILQPPHRDASLCVTARLDDSRIVRQCKSLGGPHPSKAEAPETADKSTQTSDNIAAAADAPPIAEAKATESAPAAFASTTATHDGARASEASTVLNEPQETPSAQADGQSIHSADSKSPKTQPDVKGPEHVFPEWKYWDYDRQKITQQIVNQIPEVGDKNKDWEDIAGPVAKRLGVKVEFHPSGNREDAVKLAKQIDAALEKAEKNGVKPEALAKLQFKLCPGSIPIEGANPNIPGAFAQGTIFLAGKSIRDNAAQSLKMKKGFAVGEDDGDLGTIVHEMGHGLHYINNGNSLAEFGKRQLDEGDKAVAKSVSGYAESDIAEFVAEYFTQAMLHPDKVTKEASRVYAKNRGYPINGGAKHTEA